MRDARQRKDRLRYRIDTTYTQHNTAALRAGHLLAAKHAKRRNAAMRHGREELGDTERRRSGDSPLQVLHQLAQPRLPRYARHTLGNAEISADQTCYTTYTRNNTAALWAGNPSLPPPNANRSDKLQYGTVRYARRRKEKTPR